MEFQKLKLIPNTGKKIINQIIKCEKLKEKLITAAWASNSRASEFCSVSPINYASAIDRRATSTAVKNSKL